MNLTVVEVTLEYYCKKTKEYKKLPRSFIILCVVFDILMREGGQD